MKVSDHINKVYVVGRIGDSHRREIPYVIVGEIPYKYVNQNN